MPLFNRNKDKDKDKEGKNKDREDKKKSRRDFRLAKIQEITAKAYAVAAKRKWLVFLIGIALIAYLVISSGGFNLGGIFEKIKGIF